MISYPDKTERVSGITSTFSFGYQNINYNVKGLLAFVCSQLLLKSMTDKLIVASLSHVCLEIQQD